MQLIQEQAYLHFMRGRAVPENLGKLYWGWVAHDVRDDADSTSL